MDNTNLEKIRPLVHEIPQNELSNRSIVTSYRKFLLLVPFILSFIAVAALIFSFNSTCISASFFSIQKCKNNQLQKTQIPSVVTNLPTKDQISKNIQLMHDGDIFLQYNGFFTSADGKYSFSFDSSSGVCVYTITDLIQNKKISPSLLPHSFPCVLGPTIISSFVTIADEGKLILIKRPGEILIYNLKDNTHELHTFDTKALKLISVNRSLSAWLYSRIESDTGYVLLSNNNTVLKEFMYPTVNGKQYVLFNILDDLVNDGFLFISRNFKTSNISTLEELVSYKFDFLSAKTTDIRTLLITSYTVVQGRGCGGDSLSSKLNEIIINPGCIIVSHKYLSADNKIHIKL